MLLVGNGTLITRNADAPFYADGAVAIDGRTIAAVGALDDLRAAYPQAEFIDAKGGVIMPAFINMHEHIYSAMARGMSVKGYNPHGFLDILAERNGHLYRLHQKWRDNNFRPPCELR